MNITIFQALTLLAKKYRHDDEMYQKIKSLYLSGVKTTEDNTTLFGLLDDDLLKNHKIKCTRQDINRDPVRRYFESYLCHETLANSLDGLDFDLLDYYYSELTNEIKRYRLWNDYQSLRELPSVDNLDYTILIEYYEGMRILGLPNSYQSLKPKNMPEDKALEILRKRKTKMQFLSSISLACWYLARMIWYKLPLNIYNENTGPYNYLDRGRFDREGQMVKSQTLGIMRSYMPLPLDDALLSDKPACYIRPADKAMFVSGAKQPDEGFRSFVSPFSNSLSGTLLTQLKMIAELLSNDLFVYAGRQEQLTRYFKLYFAYMIFHSGGHSLDEYTRVLQLEEVKNTFKSEPAFASLTLENLFKKDNHVAFESAVSKTIDYNDSILNKKQLAMAIPAAVEARQMKIKLSKHRFSIKSSFFQVRTEKLQSISPTSTGYDFESIEDLSNDTLTKN